MIWLPPLESLPESAPLLNVTPEIVIGPETSPAGRSAEASTAKVFSTTFTEPLTLTFFH